MARSERGRRGKTRPTCVCTSDIGTRLGRRRGAFQVRRQRQCADGGCATRCWLAARCRRARRSLSLFLLALFWVVFSPNADKNSNNNNNDDTATRPNGDGGTARTVRRLLDTSWPSSWRCRPPSCAPRHPRGTWMPAVACTRGGTSRGSSLSGGGRARRGHAARARAVHACAPGDRPPGLLPGAGAQGPKKCPRTRRPVCGRHTHAHAHADKHAPR